MSKNSLLYPHVTIGIMAYNEENYLESTIESILKQPFSDYEIIIGDNASEDKTGEIAQRYAEQYEFIRYIRHPKNIGAIQNFNTIVKQSKGKYFVLAGAHDLWSENYLEKLAKKLDNNPDIVLAHGVTKWIDENGHDLNIPTGFIDTSGFGSIARFNLILWGNQNGLYGMYRLKELKKTRLQLEIFGSGAVMLGELALLGNIAVVPEVTWFRRKNRSTESNEERINRYFRVLFSKPKIRILPHWRIPLAYFTSIFHIKLSWINRVALILSISNVLLRYGISMIYDVKFLIFSPFKFLQNK
jgi:glycosyltransferase involved in cell wall biosynthesis